MPEGHQLLLFAAAGVLLNLTPGVDVFFIVSSALRSGVRAGVAATLGITAGCCVHIAAAALGLGALIASSAEAFTVLKWIGAAYLVYIGAAMLLARDSGSAMAMSPAGGASSESAQGEFFALVRRGFLTNVLNPKVALFFLAFVPQFIAADTPHPTLAFVALGLLFNFNALWVNFGWALAAAWMARRIGAASRVMRWTERAAGLLIVGFGLKLALADAPSLPAASR